MAYTVQVHHVGARAAELAGTPVVLEATVDRRLLLRVLRAVWWLPGVPPGFRPTRFAEAFAEPERLTHRVDVRRFAAHKRAAMAAHASQAGADTGRRTLAILLKLPGPLFRAVLGHEWYVEYGRTPTRPLSDDIFSGIPDKRCPPAPRPVTGRPQATRKRPRTHLLPHPGPARAQDRVAEQRCPSGHRQTRTGNRQPPA